MYSNVATLYLRSSHNYWTAVVAEWSDRSPRSREFGGSNLRPLHSRGSTMCVAVSPLDVQQYSEELLRHCPRMAGPEAITIHNTIHYTQGEGETLNEHPTHTS